MGLIQEARFIQKTRGDLETIGKRLQVLKKRIKDDFRGKITREELKGHSDELPDELFNIPSDNRGFTYLSTRRSGMVSEWPESSNSSVYSQCPERKTHTMDLASGTVDPKRWLSPLEQVRNPIRRFGAGKHVSYQHVA